MIQDPRAHARMNQLLDAVFIMAFEPSVPSKITLSSIFLRMMVPSPKWSMAILSPVHKSRPYLMARGS